MFRKILVLFSCIISIVSCDMASKTATTISGNVTDSNSNDAISGITINFEDPISGGTYSCQTDSAGDYTISLEHSGEIDVEVDNSTYVEYHESITVPEEDTFTYDFQLTTVASTEQTTEVSGIITDSVTNNGISGCTIDYIAEGTNASGTVTTDSNGNYSFSVFNRGSVYIEISCNGSTIYYPQSRTETLSGTTHSLNVSLVEDTSG